MSVLIKGMEMPKNCDECPFIAEADDYHVCYINEQFIPWEWVDKHSAEQRHPKPSWCPLIKLPPHGLIDKQMLLQNIADNQMANAGMRHDLEYGFWQRMWEYINGTPTIIETDDCETCNIKGKRCKMLRDNGDSTMCKELRMQDASVIVEAEGEE